MISVQSNLARAENFKLLQICPLCGAKNNFTKPLLWHVTRSFSTMRRILKQHSQISRFTRALDLQRQVISRVGDFHRPYEC